MDMARGGDMRDKLIEQIMKSCDGMNLCSLEQLAIVAAAISAKDYHTKKPLEGSKRPVLSLIVGGVNGHRLPNAPVIQGARRH